MKLSVMKYWLAGAGSMSFVTGFAGLAGRALVDGSYSRVVCMAVAMVVSACSATWAYYRLRALDEADVSEK